MATKQATSTKPTTPASQKTKQSITEDERRHMIAEAAYYHAERRGFQGGSIDEDWFLAEAEIDTLLSGKKPH